MFLAILTVLSHEAVNDLMSEAATICPGADGLYFLPYLSGEMQPINDGFARGVFFGLNAEMGRAHLVRAVLEGNALAIEHNLSLARTVHARPRASCRGWRAYAEYTALPDHR